MKNQTRCLCYGCQATTAAVRRDWLCPSCHTIISTGVITGHSGTFLHDIRDELSVAICLMIEAVSMIAEQQLKEA